MKKLIILLFVSWVLLLTNCREPFLPDFETGKNDYLVVEGFINVGQKGVTNIKLSRVTSLLATSQVFENNATILIENKGGVQYPLHFVADGNYKSDSLNLNPAVEHRLLISTSAGQYTSDFVKPKITPAIDSVYWQWEVEGIQIYVSTHDTESNTRYYKWEFAETWEINSAYWTRYAYVGPGSGLNGGDFIRRDPTEVREMYYCWQHAGSEDLLFASTSQFDEDKINYPLTIFGHSTERTSVRYSILVEQRALSQEEFEYLTIIQKNSNLTGSLFDPMPSEIAGNIHSLVNSNEQVIGYVGCYTMVRNRIFVTAAEFGASPFAQCGDPLVVNQIDFESVFGEEVFLALDSVEVQQPGDIITCLAAPAYCTDCRLRGSSEKPDYWGL